MCSVGDDNLEQENEKYMPAKEKPDLSSKCNKCRERTPFVLLRSKDQYCKECFLAGTVHKFKALLGKHKLIRPNDKVLVVYKVGHPSTALLHFIRTGLDLETHKKLRFDPIVLFLEDNFNLSKVERENVVKDIQEEVKLSGFPLYLVSLAQMIKLGVDTVLNVKLELMETDKNTIEDFLKKQTTSTDRIDYLKITKQICIVNIAKILDCKFVFTPELSNDVAAQLLTDVALGRGSNTALNTGFCDSRCDTVKILRPLRLFDMKELAFYNHLNNLKPISCKETNSSKSVQQLMQSFVTNLQINYPATVTTILKTGDKLTVGTTSNQKCEFCYAPREDKETELTSTESTQFSHWVSTQALDSNLAPVERYNKTIEGFNNLTRDNYCFGCRRLINNF